MERRPPPVSHASDDDDPDDPWATTIESVRRKLCVTPDEFVEEYWNEIWSLWSAVEDWKEVYGCPFFLRTSFRSFADAVARLSV